MTIHEQPTKVAFSRSPIRYLVSDILFDQTKFEYIAEVWIWQGTYANKPVNPSNQLRVPPRHEHGNGVFDVRTIVTDHFIKQPESFPLPTDILGMYVWVEVSFGYIYEDSGGSYVIEKGLATSNPINITNGYTYPSEGINYYPDDHMGDGLNDWWMSDRPLESNVPYTVDENGTPEETSAWMFLRKETGLPVIDRIIFEHIHDGPRDDFTINLTDDGVMFEAVGVGTKQLNDGFTYPLDPGESVTFYGSDATEDPLTKSYTLNVVSACAYGYRNMQFINRYGVWDNIYFWGNRSIDLSVERSEVIISAMEVGADSMSFDPSAGQYKMTGVGGREMETWNTGWVREGWNVVFKQFMLTTRMFEADLLIAYTHGGNRFKSKTERIEKVINYTFMFKPAYTVINTI